ncbi:RNA-directed DNA polymerase from mobile element jockey [Caerostris darwini]|uniref:RNA-directed DNA polymerase from mobile element jockey n=1 Tax=Caerostris darwini TaxID=1538125 RepID=A0AAV4QEY1_9ARAC|nr:RNA-directed DNA polymerase from mobile element jockey [Caerostris darwini]
MQIVFAINELKPAKLINLSDDGFKTPGKKQTAKATEKHNPFRIPVNNKFANIEEETSSNAQVTVTDDHSPTKPPPIMLALTANYTHALQEIHRKFPKTENKLTKGYIKIFPDTEDSYRKIITYLTNAKYEYYIIRPRNERPLKIDVKRLPIDTNIDEICYVETQVPLHGGEATIISLNLNNQDALIIASIHIPPSSDNALFTLDLEILIQLGSNVILCGDFNAKHIVRNCNNINTRGNNLINFCNNTFTELIAPTTPTRFGFNSASTTDLALIKNFFYPFEIFSLPELNSDHNPIKIAFKFNYDITSNYLTKKTD